MFLFIFRHSKTLWHSILIALIVNLAPAFFSPAFAQFKPTVVTRSTNIMVQDGQKYYLHEIKEGQTLYSVSKVYNVSQKVISQENPNVPHISSGVLPLGVVIRIPYVEVVDASPDAEKDYDRFYYHIVEPKETLLSLSRQYKIHYKKIIENNQGVEEKLLIGMEVKIPKTQVAAVRETYTPPDTVYLYHKVKKGENTIKVAGIYGIKVRDLKDANPGLRWGLEEDQILKIPKDLITISEISDNKVEEYLADEETDVGKIQPDKILIDTLIAGNKECMAALRPHDSELFEVAYLLPLYLNTNDTLHKNDTLNHPQNDIYDVRFLDFLEGAYMAIDSLKYYGIRMNVRIYDTERNPEVVRDLFETGKLNNTDLIIGPVYSKPLTVASEYARKMEIPIVSPLSANGIGLEDNPYMFQVNMGEELQFELAGIFLSDFYNMNMIMIQDTSSLNPVARKKGNKIFDYLTYRVTPGELLSGEMKFNPTFAEDLPEKAVMAPVADMLSVSRKNLVMVPSNNEIFVTDLINKLNALALRYDITVFGRPEWGAFEALELEYLFNLNFHYYTNFSNPFVDYSDSLVTNFCKNYRDNWNNEPSRFSFQGFDVSYYFFKALYLYGNDFLKCTDCWENVLNHTTLQTDFCFHRDSPGKGLENQALSIIRYNHETLAKEKFKSTMPVKQAGSSKIKILPEAGK